MQTAVPFGSRAPASVLFQRWQAPCLSGNPDFFPPISIVWSYKIEYSIGNVFPPAHVLESNGKEKPKLRESEVGLRCHRHNKVNFSFRKAPSVSDVSYCGEAFLPQRRMQFPGNFSNGSRRGARALRPFQQGTRAAPFTTGPGLPRFKRKTPKCHSFCFFFRVRRGFNVSIVIDHVSAIAIKHNRFCLPIVVA